MTPKMEIDSPFDSGQATGTLEETPRGVVSSSTQLLQVAFPVGQMRACQGAKLEKLIKEAAQHFSVEKTDRRGTAGNHNLTT